jgi:hypothetical protein
MGEQIKTIVSLQNKLELNCDHLPSGIYFCEIKNGRNINKKKFVIEH